MARYINKDEFIAWVKEMYCPDCVNYNEVRCAACWIDDAIDLVEVAPEADVVSKSEFSILAVQNMALAQTRHELKLQFEEYRKLTRALSSEIEKAVSVKVAREIIDELIVALQGEIDAEEKLESSAWDESDIVGSNVHHYAVEKLETLVIALSLYKKKYTEGETDGKTVDT